MYILWVLAITNAINLIDGLDRLASAPLCSRLCGFVVPLLNRPSMVTVMTITLAGEILEFSATTLIQP